MTPELKAALRALRRAVDGPKAEAIARAEWLAADRMFDGGEWSSPRQMEEELARLDRLGREVAGRFGVDAEVLVDRYLGGG